MRYGTTLRLKISPQKLLTADVTRKAVSDVMDRHGQSERRACELAGLHRSVFQYQKQDQGNEALRKRLRELANERRRFDEMVRLAHRVAEGRAELQLYTLSKALQYLTCPCTHFHVVNVTNYLCVRLSRAMSAETLVLWRHEWQAEKQMVVPSNTGDKQLRRHCRLRNLTYYIVHA